MYVCMKIQTFKKVARMLKELEEEPTKIEVYEGDGYSRYEFWFNEKKKK